jgi:7-cyano-7-deazaguanine synthase
VKKKAVVLLSGGMDSATAMAVAREEGFELYALSFSYGQRHAIELKKAKEIARHLGAKEHLIVPLGLKAIGGSSLTSVDALIPHCRRAEEIGEHIPSTYVPARNTVFLAVSLAWAEVLGAEDIFIGINAVDYSGYPDCRSEYIKAFEAMAQLATKAGVEGRMTVRIHTPLINLRKSEIIARGVALGVDYALTHSCYDPLPRGRACGKCDSCRLRLKGFQEAGLRDPLR